MESAPARDAIVFFRGFTERCHYTKEEAELLPAMEAAIETASAGHSTALKEFTEHARAYIELLLEYIATQEDCLFPMIAQAMPGAEKARLEVTLDTACGDGEKERACDTYIDLANRLADHFDVPRAVITDSAGNRTLKESSQ